MGQLTADERAQVESGKLRLPALEQTRPGEFSRFEAYVFRGWERLSNGRRMGAMGGVVGTIPWRDVQEWLDREGIEDAGMREQLERIIYRVDAAVRTELAKVADRKIQAARRSRQPRR